MHAPGNRVQSAYVDACQWTGMLMKQVHQLFGPRLPVSGMLGDLVISREAGLGSPATQ